MCSIRAVCRVLLLSSTMLVAEVLSSSDNNDSNSTLLQDISGDSPYVDDNTWFYRRAKYAAQLENDLSTANGPFTIFLPSREASLDLEDLFPKRCLYMEYENAIGGELYYDYVLTDHLVSILRHHIVRGRAILPSELADGQVLQTMNGESLSIGRADGTAISIDGVDVVSAMPVPTTNGNIIYSIDEALLPKSIAENMPEILASCDVPYATRYCQGIRDRFGLDVTVGTTRQQPNCAACSGYFQETDQCSQDLSRDNLCIPECQWYGDHCSEDCCWDTDAAQPELAPLFKEEEHDNCFPPPCSGDGLWTVVPCDSTLTIRAGWHDSQPSGDFQTTKTEGCQIETFAKPSDSGSSSSVVWHVDCTRLWRDFKFFDPCGPISKTVAIWMEDPDGQFVGYYLDPTLKDNIMARNDSCMLQEFLRRLTVALIPTIALLLACCCYYFCCWRKQKDGDGDAADCNNDYPSSADRKNPNDDDDDHGVEDASKSNNNTD